MCSGEEKRGKGGGGEPNLSEFLLLDHQPTRPSTYLSSIHFFAIFNFKVVNHFRGGCKEMHREALCPFPQPYPRLTSCVTELIIKTRQVTFDTSSSSFTCAHVHRSCTHVHALVSDSMLSSPQSRHTTVPHHRASLGSAFTVTPSPLHLILLSSCRSLHQ